MFSTPLRKIHKLTYFSNYNTILATWLKVPLNEVAVETVESNAELISPAKRSIVFLSVQSPLKAKAGIWLVRSSKQKIMLFHLRKKCYNSHYYLLYWTTIVVHKSNIYYLLFLLIVCICFFKTALLLQGSIYTANSLY